MKRTPVNTWLDDTDPVSAPPPWSDPAIRRKMLLAGGGIVALIAVVLLIVAITAIFSGGSDSPDTAAVSPQTPSTIDTSTSSSILGCKDIRTAERSEGSGEGDTNSAEGLVLAYEHAFFVDRDAQKMVSLSVPSATVASESQLAASIKAMPVDTPWCVSVTPTATDDNFDVSVRFVESDGATVTTWNQTMTVTKNSAGQWKIAAVQGR